MITPTRRLAHLSIFASLFITLITATPHAVAQADLPANVDNGLRRLFLTEQQNRASQRAAKPSSFERSIIRDSDRRVLVEIHLSGRVPLAMVRGQVADTGGNWPGPTMDACAAFSPPPWDYRIHSFLF